VKTIRSLPKQIPYSGVLRVRGEIMMGKKQLSALNQQREKSGLSPFANTRNAAAGSIKLLDSAEVARRNLVCFVYDILE
jgi:DNA ligase